MLLISPDIAIPTANTKDMAKGISQLRCTSDSLATRLRIAKRHRLIDLGADIEEFSQGVTWVLLSERNAKY